MKGKIRRDTSSFAWDMGYGRANEKGGRERKASGSREGRGKETTDGSLNAAEQAPNAGRGPARPGRSLLTVEGVNKVRRNADLTGITGASIRNENGH